MKSLSFAVAALAYILTSSAVYAEETTALPALNIYVGDFQPTTSESRGFGPLHVIAKDMQARRVDESAEKLSRALVQALNDNKVAATKLSPSGPPPVEGWVVRGVFYSLQDDRLISIPFMSGKKDHNVEITVTIADASKSLDKPFAVIGTDAALKGQGSSLSWNPYIIAAKFAVNQTQGEKSLNALASQIATKILEHRDDLGQHATVQQP